MDILDQILAEDRAKAYSDSKGGYTKTTKTVVFPESTVSFSEEMNAHILPNCVLVEGREYSVTFNGKTSHPTASKVEENGSYYIEISNLVDGDGYQVMYVPSIGFTGLLVMKGGVYTGDVTISITTKDKTIHPIDPKFIPGAVLPVVEIANIANITEEESAALDKVATIDTPIIVKFVYMDINHAWLFNKSFAGNTFLYTCHTSLDGRVVTVSVVKQDKWIFDIAV